MKSNRVIFGAAVVMLLAALFGMAACMSAISGPSRHCVDWDTHKVTKTVTPKPKKVHKRVYDSRKHRYVNKSVNGSTPRPHKTTIKTRTCDEWQTQSSDSDTN